MAAHELALVSWKLDQPARTRLFSFVLVWILAGVLVPIFFHGCHAGGHDEDLLKQFGPPIHRQSISP
jgi:hypothetical protein